MPCITSHLLIRYLRTFERRVVLIINRITSVSRISIHKPLPLPEGGTIAVVAPASLPADLSTIDKGLANLRKRGYRIEVSRDTFRHHGYLSGPDELRADELNQYLRRPDIEMIIAVRGGYGSLRILDKLDYDAARQHPKLLVGYSDITALQLALLARAGVPSISGPMVAIEWHDPDPQSEAVFWDLVRSASPGQIIGPQGEQLQGARDGTVRGTLIGGNLSLIARLVGTPFLPDLDGAILFLEEIGEEPYRIDGLFAQLRLSGILDRIGGLVIGGFTEWKPKHDRPIIPLEEVLSHYIAELDCPVATGLQYGHFPSKNAMPIGVEARLSVAGDDAELAILEPVIHVSD